MPQAPIRHVLLTAFTALAITLAGGCDVGRSVNWKQKYEKAANRADNAENRLAALEEKNKNLTEELRSARSNLKACKEKQVKLKSELSSSRGKLGSRMRSLQEKMKRQKDRTEQVRKKLKTTRRKLEELHNKLPETVEKLTSTGQKLFRTGEYLAAEVMLKRAAELGSVRPSIAYAVGYCRARTSDYKDARKWYQRALKRLREQDEPNELLFAKTLNNCGIACEELDKPRKARELYSEALSVNEDFAPAHFNAGRLYKNKLDKPGKAVTHLRRHAALGGNRSAAAREAIGEIQAAQNRASDNE